MSSSQARSMRLKRFRHAYLYVHAQPARYPTICFISPRVPMSRKQGAYTIGAPRKTIQLPTNQKFATKFSALYITGNAIHTSTALPSAAKQIWSVMIWSVRANHMLFVVFLYLRGLHSEFQHVFSANRFCFLRPQSSCWLLFYILYTYTLVKTTEIYLCILMRYMQIWHDF